MNVHDKTRVSFRFQHYQCRFFNVLGDVLITAATGPLSELEASRAGLVPTHAYAVLDMRLVKVSLIKNDYQRPLY